MSPEAEELLSLNLSEPVLMRNLPPRLAAWARVIGMEAVILLADRYGGRKLYLAKVVSEGSDVARLIGRGTAQAPSDYFGENARVEVPNGLMGRDLVRLGGIAMLEAGSSCGEIANALRVTPRTVQHWKSRYLERQP